MNILKKKAVILFIITGSFFSCSLNEYNPKFTTEDEKLQTFDGFYGLTNYCYQPIYGQLFTASDYLSTTEAGTDLWITANNSNNTQQLFYYEGLSPVTNATNKLFTQAYSSINLCNKVINKAPNVTEGSVNDIRVLTAEAYCLRAFYYSILVEQYGEITLTLNDNTQGVNYSPKRSSIADIYKQIIKDLKYATENLDVDPYGNNYGRVSKKTALGLLARAYIQGAGYNLTDEETGKSYLQMAKETAENFIANEGNYKAGLYDTFAEVWLQKNNRGNSESLFSATGALATGDAAQYSTNMSLYRYFFPNVGSFSDLGMIQNGYYYGRTNAALYVPSKYLLSLFDEGDDRYDKSFVSAYSTYSYNRTGSAIGVTEITKKISDLYGIDPSWIGTKLGPQVDLLSADWKYNTVRVYKYPYEVDTDNAINGWKLEEDSRNVNLYTALNNPAEDDLRVRLYFSRKPLTISEKAKRPYYTLNMDQIYDADGSHIKSSSNGKDQSLWPGLVKFSHYEADLNNTYQHKRGDVMIMRMAEIYLIAAEANIRLNTPAQAVPYINALRDRATKPGYNLTVSASDMTLDFILDEYARELCGEFNRWYILKRNHKLEDRLSKYNKRAANSFTSNKHYLRPISQDFLNDIDNPEEYGTNGY